MPTWDYERVEVVGSLAPTDDALLMDMLSKLSEHEARIPDKPPWTMNKLSGPTSDRLVKWIVGATLSIESIRGTRKLSQNKSRADIDSVIAALKRSQSRLDHDLADRLCRPVTQSCEDPR